MAQIQFSWNTQKSLGLLLILFGWALSFQFIPLYHSFEVLGLGGSENDWMVYLGVLLSMSVVLTFFMGSIYENFFDASNSNNAIINIHTVVIFAYILFLIGFSSAIPFLQALEPVFGLNEIASIDGWVEYLFSQISALFLVIVFWLISEKY